MKLFNPMLPPWIVMFTAFVFFVKGLEDHAFLLLYTLESPGHGRRTAPPLGRTVPSPSGPWLVWPLLCYFSRSSASISS